jgi:hypothetical protein
MIYVNQVIGLGVGSELVVTGTIAQQSWVVTGTTAQVGWSPERQRNKSGDLRISRCDDSGGLSLVQRGKEPPEVLLYQTKGFW